MIENIFKFYLN